MRGLLDWLSDPSTERGIHSLQSDGSWSFASYAALAGRAFAVRQQLRECGVRPGNRVAVALESGPQFAAGFFGVSASGATVLPLALPSGLQGQADYQRRVRGVLAAARPSCLLTEPDRLATFEQARTAVPTVAIPAEGCSGEAGLDVPEHALLQFTSGSTGLPKGVRVSTDALQRHLGGIRRWLSMSEEDGTATWLPLHHDMGLIGGFLTPITTGGDLWLMRPDQFIRSPLPWLRCLGQGAAQLTASPNFGLEYVSRKVSADSLDGLDFSRWRALIVGAERIDPAALANVHDLLAGHGFATRTFLPAYGLAEAILAVTGLALPDEPRTVRLDRSALIQGEALRECPPGAPGLALVGCGGAIVGNAVTIVGTDGAALADGRLGEIVVSGPSMADGYVRDEDIPDEIKTDSRLHTGDLGAILHGQLFVLGRAGDSIKRRARTVFAEDLEALVRQVPALRQLRPIVLLGALDGLDTAVVMVKCKPGPWIAELIELLRAPADGIPVRLCLRPPVGQLRTSSGKPRRLPLWAAVASGEIATASAEQVRWPTSETD